MCGRCHADSKEARQELMLRCLALLGVSGEAWDSSNAAAATRCICLADTLLPELAPILPSWRPPGMPPGRASAISADSAGAAEMDPAALLEEKLGWLSPLPIYQAAPADGVAETEADAMAGRGESPAPSGQATITPAGAKAGRVGLPSAWYLASEERRQFVVRLLELLALGPFGSDAAVADALLCAEAAEAQPVSPSLNHDRAQATAQRLLAKHRDSLPLWQAYAKQVLAAKQMKVHLPDPGCLYVILYAHRLAVTMFARVQKR